MFPDGDAVGRHVYWTDPVLQFFPGSDKEKARFKAPHRIIGVAADVDDLHVVPQPTVTIYGTFAEGLMFGGHLFVHTTANPYALVTPVTHIIRQICPPISPSNTPPLSKTSAPKCSRLTA